MDVMDTRANTQRIALLELKKAQFAKSTSAKKKTLVQIAPIDWEMSAHEALEVNYLTRTMRSIKPR